MWKYLAQSYHRNILENHLRANAANIVGSILDIGSGSRRYDHLFTGHITAIDLAAKPEKDIVYVNLEEGLPYPDESFDSVLCVEVLDYIEAYRHAIEEIHRVLKPGGVAIISVAFMYHECSDKLRFTESYLTSFLEQTFASVRVRLIGNGAIIIWDILRKKIIFGPGPKLWRGILLLTILPYLGWLRVTRRERRHDQYYSGLFYLVRKAA